MKAYMMMVVMVILIALPAVGQTQKVAMGDISGFERISFYSRPYLETAARNYEINLNSEYNGIVEASITCLTFLKVTAPQIDLDDARAKLSDLAVVGKTPAIRYKAYLATMVFENPRAFRNALDVGALESDQFFNKVAEQVSRALFGYKTK